MAVAIAVGGVLGLLISAMIKAGLQTLHYAMRQNMIMTNARKALVGDGDKMGVIGSVRLAVSVKALSDDSLALTPAEGASSSFVLCPPSLCLSHHSLEEKRADGVSSFAVGYYNLNDEGLIMRSTAPESVALVSAYLELDGADARLKSRGAWSVTRLRNSP